MNKDFDMNPLTISWELNYSCNYKCPYCPYYGQWQDLVKYDNFLSSKQWIKAWTRFYKKYGLFYLEINGGEPFMYPGFVELAKEVSKLHSLIIKTNLSFEINQLIKEVNPNRVNITPYLHPLFTDLDSFIKKSLLLKEQGFMDKVYFVVYPLQLKYMEKIRVQFEKVNLSLKPVSMESFSKGKYHHQIKDLKKSYFDDRSDLDKFINPKGKLCRAGQMFVYVDVRGRVFRCGQVNSKDLLGNILDENFRLINKPVVCNSDYCFNFRNVLVEQDHDRMKLGKVANRQLEFSWDFWHKCNYDCSYCFYHGQWNNLDTFFENIDRKKLFQTWDKIYEKYGSVNIILAGAEPSLYPDFLDFLERLTKHHTISFSTNLSWDVKYVDKIIARLDSTQLDIICSFHPEFANWEEFLEKVLLLKKAGFLSPQQTVCVGWPPILKQIPEYKEKFDQRGINLRIQPFHGEYKGRSYPNSYSKQERELIYSLAKTQSKENKLFINYQMGDYNPKGKLCRAGQTAVIISSNGVVYRCANCKNRELGKFLDVNFDLLDEALPCESDYCACDFEYLVEYDK